MLKHFSLLCAVLCAVTAAAQLNMSQLGNVNYQSLHGVQLNDVWGYVDENGNEYALVGTTDGVGVVDVTDPANPNEVFWVPGMNSVWRDLKTWGDYAYITTEAENGLLIIDLSPLPGSTNLPTTLYEGPLGDEWQSAHNLWIDENGVCYIFGANRDNGGVIMLDVDSDPMNPIEIGTFENWYVHDGWVKNDTGFFGHISDGFFSMVDLTDKSNPVLLATQITPGQFSHNIWGSDDLDHVYTTDEIGGGYVAGYDVSDPLNISETDRVQSNPGEYVIPHNTHFFNDYIITSYYRDGILVHDVADPENIIEVANFDTSPLDGNGFDGSWGAYPYLPSGNILATDMQMGLFVLGVNYQRACYLEGNVTDQSNGFPIGDVQVSFLSEPITTDSKISGDYKTGLGVAGTYQVEFRKPGYRPDTITVSLVQGQVVVEDVALVPLTPFVLNGIALDGGGQPIQNAVVRLESIDYTYSATTDASGNFQINTFYESDYDGYAGHWGHVNDCFFNTFIDNSSGPVVFNLQDGFYDDFSLDLGWIVTTVADRGGFERGVPGATTSGSAPGVDAPYGCGSYAYLTDPTPGNPNNTDLHEGWTELRSPWFDISSMSDPYVNYHKWFYCQFGPEPEDDSLIISLTNGTTTVRIDTMSHASLFEAQWVDTSIRVLDHITTGAPLRLLVYTSDTSFDYRNITEAGFDQFNVTEGPVVLDLSEEEITDPGFDMYPNPGSETVVISYQGIADELDVIDLSGRVVLQCRGGFATELDITSMAAGTYVVRLRDAHTGQRIVRKLLISR